MVNVILDGEFIHIHGKFMGYSWIMGYEKDIHGKAWDVYHIKYDHLIFCIRVGARRHAEDMLVSLRRQSRLGRFSIVCQVHDHPTKKPAEGTRIRILSRKTPA